jgi:sugar lactone lactonase YvrE
VTVVAGLPGGGQQMLDGVGTNAQFSSIGVGLTAGPDNSLYLSDADSLRKIDPVGNTTLLAGYRIVQNDSSGNPPYGAIDGPASTARFQNALGLAVGPDGLLYVADAFNYAIRRVDAAGNTSTYAGVMGSFGTADGTRLTARFFKPGALAFAPDGSLYIADNGSLRRISADGSSVTTIAGVGGVGKLAIDASGNIFFGAATGLYMIAAGTTTATQLIAGGTNDADVLGTSPHLGAISAIALAGPKQIVMIGGGQLVKATLP